VVAGARAALKGAGARCGEVLEQARRGLHRVAAAQIVANDEHAVVGAHLGQQARELLGQPLWRRERTRNADGVDLGRGVEAFGDARAHGHRIEELDGVARVVELDPRAVAGAAVGHASAVWS
jgi:hypothetical protein